MLNPTLNIPKSSSNNIPLKFNSIDKHGTFANPDNNFVNLEALAES